jgi:hypothetical protein
MKRSPYTIDNGHGEQLTFTGMPNGPDGDRAETEGVARLRCWASDACALPRGTCLVRLCRAERQVPFTWTGCRITGPRPTPPGEGRTVPYLAYFRKLLELASAP